MSELIPTVSADGSAASGAAAVAALSEAEIAGIDAELAHLPTPAAAAIDALKIVQQHRGWVSDASLLAVARHLGIPPAELEGVATFYNLIFRHPVGERVILLCNSISCWIKGCDSLQADITRRLGVGLGETTDDQRFTLLPVTCLGACDRAPVMMVGEELHETVDQERLTRLFGDGQGSR
jgi:NADH-quinone oxidoreductase subunit E